MKSEKYLFNSAGTELPAEIVFAQKPLGCLLFLNGGANIPVREQSYITWQEAMAEVGISSMVFDYRGIEGTGIELGKTSIQTRLEDAREAVKVLREKQPDKPLVLLGVSMGAPIAIELAYEIHADGLVVVSPAAYSEEAHHKNFGPDFSEAIRKSNNWVGSPDFQRIQQFQGWIVVAYGEQDTVVPHEIRESYAEIAMSKGGVVIAEPVEHSFARLMTPASIEAREKITEAIKKLLTS